MEEVRNVIVDGDLRPEETYLVYLLADLLGISRSPVREGILRLAAAGLVEINRNRGFESGFRTPETTNRPEHVTPPAEVPPNCTPR